MPVYTWKTPWSRYWYGLHQAGHKRAEWVLGRAILAVHSLHYLADLDDETFTRGGTSAGHPEAAVERAHVAWATTDAVTAIDICAAVLGRVRCWAPGSTGGIEHSLSYFDPKGKRKASKVANDRAKLGPAELAWVDAMLGDDDYLMTLRARHALVHSNLSSVHWMKKPDSAPAHGARCEFPVGPKENVDGFARELVNCRTVIETARDMATRGVEAFLADVVMPWAAPYEPDLVNGVDVEPAPRAK